MIAVLSGHGPGRRYRGAAQGARGFWVAPTHGVASAIWRDLKAACGGAWEDKSESEHRITLQGGGSVSVRSADNPDNLRGVGLDFLVIDEAAFVAEEAWTEVLRPTLADRQGWAIFISTPKGLNWFHGLYQRAATEPGWARWQRPTSENPRVPAAELAASRAEIGSYAFSQEFLAEFVTAGGGLIHREWLRYYDRDGDWIRSEGSPPVHLTRLRRFATVDLAASTKTTADYTVVAVCGHDPETGRTYLLHVLRARLEAPDVVPQIRRLVEGWRLSAVWIERVGYQLAIVQQAQRDGLPVLEVVPDRDKVARALPLAAALEGGRLLLPRSASWLADLEPELLAFPAGAHDDQVDALAYAVAVSGRGGALNPPSAPALAAPRERPALGGLLPARPSGW